MEAHQVKPDMKRHHENDESEQNKSQRLDSTDEPEDTGKIVDLNNFCLINIFENLDCQSLFNVAIANGRLRPAAINVYHQKFGKRPVKICDFRHNRPKIRGQINDIAQRIDGVIRIFGLNTCLQYLRCFGSSVSDLTIYYNNDSKSKRHEYVNQYINDYCSDSLVSIRFQGMPNIAIGQFQKIFINVQSVDIYCCDLGQQFVRSTFVRCFPNLRCFEASHSRFYLPIGQKPFQYLEHLSLRDIRCYGFRKSQFVADVLNGLHDLKSLEVANIHDARYGPFLDLIKDNPSITKLNCSVYQIILLDSNDVQRIAAEHPALIELKLQRYLITADDAIALVRQLNSLKKFQFWMEDSGYARLISQLDDEWKATAFPFLYYNWLIDFEVTLKR